MTTAVYVGLNSLIKMPSKQPSYVSVEPLASSHRMDIPIKHYSYITFTLHIYDLDFISRGGDDCVGVSGEKADKTVNTVWNNVFCGNKNGSFRPGSIGISSCICTGRYKWKLLLWIKYFSFMQYVFPLMHNLPFCLTWCDPASISTLCIQEFEWSYLELFFWSKAHGTQGLMLDSRWFTHKHTSLSSQPLPLWQSHLDIGFSILCFSV